MSKQEPPDGNSARARADETARKNLAEHLEAAVILRGGVKENWDTVALADEARQYYRLTSHLVDSAALPPFPQQAVMSILEWEVHCRALLAALRPAPATAGKGADGAKSGETTPAGPKPPTTINVIQGNGNTFVQTLGVGNRSTVDASKEQDFWAELWRRLKLLLGLLLKWTH